MIARAEEATLLPIEVVRPSPFRVRLVLGVATIQQLDAEAKRTESVEPVVVWEREQRRYVVLEGEWRRRVALRAGMKTLPVRIREVRNERDAEIQTLVAELRRWGPAAATAVAEGEAYARLVELGMTQTEIAKAVHREKSTVSKRLRLSRLPENVRVLIDAGVLNGKQGQELYRFLERPEVFAEVVRRAVAEGLSSRQVAKLRVEDVEIGARSREASFTVQTPTPPSGGTLLPKKRRRANRRAPS